MVPLGSECTIQHICFLRWTEAWILLVYNCRLVHHKINGTQEHKNCISIGQRSTGGFEQSVFGDLIGVWPETDGNVHHCCTFLFLATLTVSESRTCTTGIQHKVFNVKQSLQQLQGAVQVGWGTPACLTLQLFTQVMLQKTKVVFQSFSCNDLK